jgi:hypothetical protein
MPRSTCSPSAVRAARPAPFRRQSWQQPRLRRSRLASASPCALRGPQRRGRGRRGARRRPSAARAAVARQERERVLPVARRQVHHQDRAQGARTRRRPASVFVRGALADAGLPRGPSCRVLAPHVHQRVGGPLGAACCAGLSRRRPGRACHTGSATLAAPSARAAAARARAPAAARAGRGQAAAGAAAALHRARAQAPAHAAHQVLRPLPRHARQRRQGARAAPAPPRALLVGDPRTSCSERVQKASPPHACRGRALPRRARERGPTGAAARRCASW